MNISSIELPSNRKFGFFFTGVFFAASAYFYFEENATSSYVFAAFGTLLLFATVIKADVLLRLNKLWMQLGLLLGMVVSPIVLGIIFFGLFTPIGTFMRVFGRDELRLNFKKKESYWISRDPGDARSDTYKHQF